MTGDGTVGAACAMPGVCHAIDVAHAIAIDTPMSCSQVSMPSPSPTLSASRLTEISGPTGHGIGGQTSNCQRIILQNRWRMCTNTSETTAVTVTMLTT